MTCVRLLDHLETAVLQEDPVRRLRLAGLVLEADPGNAPARALAALSVPDLRRASVLVEGAFDRGRRPGSLAGASPALRAVAEALRATREILRLDPHAAGERLSGLVGAELPRTVAAPVLRLAMAASAATGDIGGLSRALDRGGALPALAREAAWFRWILAVRVDGKPHAALLDAAEEGLPAVREAIDGPARYKPGNPGAFADGADMVAVAAVLPGLFQAGGLPGRKRIAAAA